MATICVGNVGLKTFFNAEMSHFDTASQFCFTIILVDLGAFNKVWRLFETNVAPVFLLFVDIYIKV